MPPNSPSPLSDYCSSFDGSPLAAHSLAASPLLAPLSPMPHTPHSTSPLTLNSPHMASTLAAGSFVSSENTISIEECDINGWLHQDANYEMHVGCYEDVYSEGVSNPAVQEVPELGPILQEIHNLEPILQEVPNQEPILEEEPILDSTLEEHSVEDLVQCESVISYDPANPKIELNALFPDSKTFRDALRHFAIINQFEVFLVKCDTRRYIGKCSHDTCPWRIRASILQDNKTFMVKVLPAAHTCPSKTMVDGKMVSHSWVSERARDWVRKNPTCSAADIKNRLEDEFHVKVNYNKAWRGIKDAVGNLHGSWEGSFQELFNFKAELESRCPGSIIEIDCEKVGNKTLFKSIFVALKPCIDGFLNGCRPYFGVDSTHLTGKYKGQLAAAVGIDGCNGLFPIAYGTFDPESTESWTWFMTQLKRAVGTPTGLAISSDASKGLAAAIATTFPEAEHRECIRHLKDNFLKKFYGDLYFKHLWPASITYTSEDCEHHLGEVEKLSPAAHVFLKNHHSQVWCRSKFNEVSKCDYITNNISESFNSWIKDLKELHLVDLVDKFKEESICKNSDLSICCYSNLLAGREQQKRNSEGSACDGVNMKFFVAVWVSFL